MKVVADIMFLLYTYVKKMTLFFADCNLTTSLGETPSITKNAPLSIFTKTASNVGC